MYKIIQATYQNGNLILDKKLSSIIEGKIINIIVLDTDIAQTKKERFLEFVDRHSFALPADYIFNRELELLHD